MKKYNLCTIREFARNCADIIVNQGKYNSSYCFDAPLPNYNLAIVDNTDKEMTLEEIALSAEGWYGLKKFNAGFDNVDMCLIADYYGGGCMKVASISGDDGIGYIIKTIEEIICTSLNINEYADTNTLLIIEIDNYFETVEICPHCDNENIYPMWNVEYSGYIATCKHCEKEIFLCDECFHSEDNEYQTCDWCETECGGKCFRGIIVDKKEG